MKRPAHLIRHARAQRKQPTPAERAMWARLRGSPGGVKFQRQHPVNGFILDFCCPAARVAIELDGDSHSDKCDADARRDSRLAEFGWLMLRIPNSQALDDSLATAEWILMICLERIQERS